jgi:hypothetical protein
MHGFSSSLIRGIKTSKQIKGKLNLEYLNKGSYQRKLIRPFMLVWRYPWGSTLSLQLFLRLKTFITTGFIYSQFILNIDDFLFCKKITIVSYYKIIFCRFQ